MRITHEATCELVGELARLTGESPEAAVDAAVRERLARVHRRHADRLADRLLAISADAARRLPADLGAADPSNQLYDEAGLPESRAEQLP
ncbi:type II toxin-antitoxin system VapB family antitoxin [Kribbella yunnanensis]|uniref:type II toxin-antitoxin system VapB family antitoxin n=1 Tax=Kribbella yunnanensis TaxID=190194 RepID=UPI0031DF9701